MSSSCFYRVQCGKLRRLRATDAREITEPQSIWRLKLRNTKFPNSLNSAEIRYLIIFRERCLCLYQLGIRLESNMNYLNYFIYYFFCLFKNEPLPIHRVNRRLPGPWPHSANWHP